MKTYWRVVHDRTLQQAAKAAGLDSRDKAITTVAAQGFIAASILFFSIHADLVTRVLTALVPFLLLPVWYLVKLPGTPVLLAAEAEASFARQRDEAEQNLRKVTAERDTALSKLQGQEDARAAKPHREMMAIYQHGVKVGTVEGSVSPQVSRSMIQFQRITFGDQFDMDAPFEFGDFVLRITESPVRFGGIRIGGTVSISVLAQIVGRQAA